MGVAAALCTEPLRRLSTSARRDGWGRDSFGFLPTLKFYRSKSGIGGAVDELRLAPLPEPSSGERRSLALIVGRSLALWSWLGVSDLHWENLVLGVNREGGRIVFGPVDIEMILAELSLPTETKLLPDADRSTSDRPTACDVGARWRTSVSPSTR